MLVARMILRCDAGAEGEVLLVGGEGAEEREHAQVVLIGGGLQQALGAADFLGAGEEGEHVAGLVGWVCDAALHGVGDLLGEVERTRSGFVADLDRVGAAGSTHDRTTAQERGGGFGLERGGHDHQDQIRADGLLHLAQQGDGQVAVQAAFMELVQQHRAHAGEERVVEQLAGEDAFGDDPQRRVGPKHALEPHLVSDLFAEGPAVFVGDAGGHGAGGDAARLEHQQARMLGAEQAGSQQGGGHAGGLARTRRGDQHQRPGVPHLRHDVGQEGIDRERGHGAV